MRARSQQMIESTHKAISIPVILLVMTAVTGIVDAVSFLALGRVFTANMTGNIVFLGFAMGGAPGLSISRSLLALTCFALGAIIGGRMTGRLQSSQWTVRALSFESILLLTAAAISLGLVWPYVDDHSLKVHGVIASTAMAMGLRNAVVRKLGVPELTTTVLTLTITGLAADSVLAGGENPRWLRRCAAIAAMLGGAAAGAAMLHQSMALALFVSGIVSAAGACAAFESGMGNTF